MNEGMFDFLYITDSVITIILKVGLVSLVYHYLDKK